MPRLEPHKVKSLLLTAVVIEVAAVGGMTFDDGPLASPVGTFGLGFLAGVGITTALTGLEVQAVMSASSRKITSVALLAATIYASIRLAGWWAFAGLVIAFILTVPAFGPLRARVGKPWTEASASTKS